MPVASRSRLVENKKSEFLKKIATKKVHNLLLPRARFAFWTKIEPVQTRRNIMPLYYEWFESEVSPIIPRETLLDRTLSMRRH